MNIFSKIRKDRQIKKAYGSSPTELLRIGAWKNDVELCRELEEPGYVLDILKTKADYDRESMSREIYRFLPDWESHAIFSEYPLSEMQWNFFSWDGKVRLSKLVEQRRELFMRKWEDSRFGVATGEAELFREAWKMFTLGTREAPEDILSKDAQDSLAPYILVWKEETSLFNESVSQEEEHKHGLDLLYDYHVGEFDPSDSWLESAVEAVNAGVPVRDVIGEVPDSLNGM